jgi:hypothetical protein
MIDLLIWYGVVAMVVGAFVFAWHSGRPPRRFRGPRQGQRRRL